MTLAAGDDIEHGGQAGPQIRTGGNVSLAAGDDIGATSTLRIEGHRRREGPRTSHRERGRARRDVNVDERGLPRRLVVTATRDAADIDVTQFGGDVIDIGRLGRQEWW